MKLNVWMLPFLGVSIAVLAGCGKTADYTTPDSFRSSVAAPTPGTTAGGYCDDDVISQHNQLLELLREATKVEQFNQVKQRATALRAKYPGLDCRAKNARTGAAENIRIDSFTADLIASADKLIQKLSAACTETFLAEYRAIQEKLNLFNEAHRGEDLFQARELTTSFAEKYRGIRCGASVKNPRTQAFEETTFDVDAEVKPMFAEMNRILSPKCSTEVIAEMAALEAKLFAVKSDAGAKSFREAAQTFLTKNPRLKCSGMIPSPTGKGAKFRILDVERDIPELLEILEKALRKGRTDSSPFFA